MLCVFHKENISHKTTNSWLPNIRIIFSIIQSSCGTTPPLPYLSLLTSLTRVVKHFLFNKYIKNLDTSYVDAGIHDSIICISTLCIRINIKTSSMGPFLFFFSYYMEGISNYHNLSAQVSSWERDAPYHLATHAFELHGLLQVVLSYVMKTIDKKRVQ